ncbi:UNKNOWN [Stylonychia lemnae]|uniref:Uncharacterized protein n=1 Tax=Stylonychia lemnae TaxID=5949 RepID=A0A078AQB4_STYLE|nr:UNKNOWN [Stylonychia lemnae]|eukprot:CDW83437.1 UNKNOWN [Stylonychia lemnae]
MGGIQFFYLGQADQFTKINYHFEPNQSSYHDNNINKQGKAQHEYLGTDSINRQLEDLNFTYSYPAMFIYKQYHLVLFGGINVFTGKTTNEMLLIDIQDFKNPIVKKIKPEFNDGQKYNYKDYFFGNQISKSQDSFSMKGEHGIYEAKIKLLPITKQTVQVKKIFNF